MILTDAGRLGIGTGAPSEKLHVSGNIRTQNETDYLTLAVNNSSRYSEIRFGDDTDDRFRIFFDNNKPGDLEVASFWQTAM